MVLYIFAYSKRREREKCYSGKVWNRQKVQCQKHAQEIVEVEFIQKV